MKSQNARGGLEIPEILKGKSRHISRITMTIALGFSAAAVESWRIITGEQSPVLTCNSNGILDFPDATQEAP